jgi:hypothetical protein
VFDNEYETAFIIHQHFMSFHGEGTVYVSMVNC